MEIESRGYCGGYFGWVQFEGKGVCVCCAYVIRHHFPGVGGGGNVEREPEERHVSEIT